MSTAKYSHAPSGSKRAKSKSTDMRTGSLVVGTDGHVVSKQSTIMSKPDTLPVNQLTIGTESRSKVSPSPPEPSTAPAVNRPEVVRTQEPATASPMNFARAAKQPPPVIPYLPNLATAHSQFSAPISSGRGGDSPSVHSHPRDSPRPFANPNPNRMTSPNSPHYTYTSLHQRRKKLSPKHERLMAKTPSPIRSQQQRAQRNFGDIRSSATASRIHSTRGRLHKDQLGGESPIAADRHAYPHAALKHPRVQQAAKAAQTGASLLVNGLPNGRASISSTMEHVLRESGITPESLSADVNSMSMQEIKDMMRAQSRILETLDRQNMQLKKQLQGGGGAVAGMPQKQQGGVQHVCSSSGGHPLGGVGVQVTEIHSRTPTPTPLQSLTANQPQILSHTHSQVVTEANTDLDPLAMKKGVRHTIAHPMQTQMQGGGRPAPIPQTFPHANEQAVGPDGVPLPSVSTFHPSPTNGRPSAVSANESSDPSGMPAPPSLGYPAVSSTPPRAMRSRQSTKSQGGPAQRGSQYKPMQTQGGEQRGSQHQEVLYEFAPAVRLQEGQELQMTADIQTATFAQTHLEEVPTDHAVAPPPLQPTVVQAVGPGGQTIALGTVEPTYEQYHQAYAQLQQPEALHHDMLVRQQQQQQKGGKAKSQKSARSLKGKRPGSAKSKGSRPPSPASAKGKARASPKSKASPAKSAKGKNSPASRLATTQTKVRIGQKGKTAGDSRIKQQTDVAGRQAKKTLVHTEHQQFLGDYIGSSELQPMMMATRPFEPEPRMIDYESAALPPQPPQHYILHAPQVERPPPPPSSKPFSPQSPFRQRDLLRAETGHLHEAGLRIPHHVVPTRTGLRVTPEVVSHTFHQQDIVNQAGTTPNPELLQELQKRKSNAAAAVSSPPVEEMEEAVAEEILEESQPAPLQPSIHPAQVQSLEEFVQGGPPIGNGLTPDRPPQQAMQQTTYVPHPQLHMQMQMRPANQLTKDKVMPSKASPTKGKKRTAQKSSNARTLGTSANARSLLPKSRAAGIGSPLGRPGVGVGTVGGRVVGRAALRGGAGVGSAAVGGRTGNVMGRPLAQGYRARLI
uniref:Uncharacterized protein n=1 Tax=Chromera velia CCMP2878 TaxID=1169474 RepID=A0A0G4I6B7_9ALVE|eukprot:Cvel_11364.t1-p1 / transcript=Cvel_11364.t1 / gene=Cvel_11364 / organism=Chromera_velia_CCMP2878 / gene_product=hypothetical protein / transcript_product=hypothetical protein / location=Cvel_scaffold712:33938-37762(-) / protein_length=1072 / sequence_SO=supercontig / SO=protein_coding / is_pseudo=false